MARGSHPNAFMDRKPILLSLSLAAATALILAPALAEPPSGPDAPSRVDKGDLNDAEIIGILEVANDAEVDQGSFAEEHARAPTVRAFAQMMVKHHGAAKQKTVATAKQLHVVPKPSAQSGEVQSDSASMMKDLRDSDPDDFDKTYMNAQIKAHEKLLRMIDGDLVPSAAAPELKKLLADTRAQVQQHLAMAHSKRDQLKK
jgi:putative membrane protein